MVAFLRPRALTTSPSVSIVVPCYNYGSYLASAVTSALEQERVNVTVLIIDDASTDDSAAVARSLASNDERVDATLHEENMGHIRTYNDGLAKVSGDYVLLLSADDLIAPNALQRAASLMERHREVGFVYGVARSFRVNPSPLPHPALSWSIWPGMDWLRVNLKRGRNVVRTPAVVMRREALEDAGGYDPRLPHSGDFDMWLRTALNWDVGRVNGGTQAHYRVHGSNMSLTTYGGWVTDLYERRKTFDILFRERASDRPEVTGLRDPAMWALACDALRRALAAQREGAAPELVGEILNFALDTSPGVQSTVLWRRCEFGPIAGRNLPAVRARRLGAHAREYLRWHTWP